MHRIAQYGSYYLPLTVKFYYTILKMKYMDYLQDSLQLFAQLNVMKSISNKMFKNIFLIIYVLDEF